MPWLSADLKRRIREEEWLESWRDLTARLEKEKRIPFGPVLHLRRLELYLALVGALLTGGVIGATTLILNFFVFNWVLHLF